MKFLKWVGSLIAATIGLFVILGVGCFFALFGGVIAAVGLALAAVVFVAYAITEYFEDRGRQRKGRSIKTR